MRTATTTNAAYRAPDQQVLALARLFLLRNK